MAKLGDSPIGAASTVPPPKAAEIDLFLDDRPPIRKDKPRKKQKAAPHVSRETTSDRVPLTDMVGQVAEMVLQQGYTVRDLKTFCNLIPKALRMGWKNQNRRGIQR